MSGWFVWGVVLVSSYLLGSMPVGYLVVRWTRGIDVRQVGSGRIGGTNVLRAAGWKVALASGLLDGCKGLLSVLLARGAGDAPWLWALAGVAAVVGHNFSVFLRFRGGAGTSTSVGGATGLWPWSLPILAAVLFGVGLGSRRASLGSIAVAIALPTIFVVRAALGLGPWAFVLHGVLTSAVTLWALRPNIERLRRGEERQIDLSGGRA